jgi:hypothetical protein
MSGNKILAVVFTGLTWVFLGIGFFSAYLGYLPAGQELAVEAVGLFLAGVISGLLYAGIRTLSKSKFGVGLVSVGYILFVPVGIMLALLVPHLINMSEAPTSMRVLILTPFAIALFSNILIAVGLGLTTGLALSATSLSNRVQGVRVWSEPVRIK